MNALSEVAEASGETDRLDAVLEIGAKPERQNAVSALNGYFD